MARLALWFLLLLQDAAQQQPSGSFEKKKKDYYSQVLRATYGDHPNRRWEWGPLLGSKVGVVKQGPRSRKRHVGPHTWLLGTPQSFPGRENVMGEARLGAYLEVVIQLVMCLHKMGIFRE